MNPWVRKIPWKREWQPTPVFLLENSMGRGAWWARVHGIIELDMTVPTLSLVGSLCPSSPLLQPSFPPQSTLGFVALVLSTLHTLTYGWTRAFEESRYKFFLPPTFTLTLLVPCVIILAKGLFLLPCISRRLTKIRRGWEKDGSIRFTLPVDHALAQKTSHV